MGRVFVYKAVSGWLVLILQVVILSFAEIYLTISLSTHNGDDTPQN